MKQAVVAYTLGNAVHRGVVWITLLFLAAFLSPADVGVYALAQTVATLLTPLIAINGGAAILREGVSQPAAADAFLRRFVLVAVAMTAVLSMLVAVLPVGACEWLFEAVLLAAASALLTLVLAHFQAANRYWRYFWTCSVKGALVAGSLLVAARVGLTARELLMLQAVLLLTQSGLIFICMLPRLVSRTSASFTAAIAFTAPLLPYSLAQWVMSSSDRLILRGMIDEAAVGEYSIAYALSAGLVLFNAGVGTALPRYAIENFSRWCERTTRVPVILGYTVIALLAAVLTTLGITMLGRHTDLLARYDLDQLREITLWVLGGQYFLGLYQIYATYLFYHRRSGLLATQTLCGAATNFVLTILLVSQMGVRGAAIATFVGYFVYLAPVVLSLGTVGNSLRKAALQESAAVLSCCSLLGVAVFVTQYFLI